MPRDSMANCLVVHAKWLLVFKKKHQYVSQEKDKFKHLLQAFYLFDSRGSNVPKVPGLTGF